jgi:predicted negative regulator of RcsB-dependent stress response
VALQASEEETIENLKTWWDESGKRLVLIAIAVLAAYASWLLLQNSRIATLEVASDLYEEVLRNAVLEPGTVPDEG